MIGNTLFVGTEMQEAITKIDEKGRVTIPKAIRKQAKLKPGTYVNIKSKNHTIIIEPSKSISEKYCGIFQVDKWPEDLDEFAAQGTISNDKDFDNKEIKRTM